MKIIKIGIIKYIKVISPSDSGFNVLNSIILNIFMNGSWMAYTIKLPITNDLFGVIFSLSIKNAMMFMKQTHPQIIPILWIYILKLKFFVSKSTIAIIEYIIIEEVKSLCDSSTMFFLLMLKNAPRLKKNSVSGRMIAGWNQNPKYQITPKNTIPETFVFFIKEWIRGDISTASIKSLINQNG